MDKRKQVVVIPAYKPIDELEKIVLQLIDSFANIIVVDDGSGVEYIECFKRIETIGCVVLHHYVNLGKGRALKTAFNYCLSQCIDASSGVITVDADGQHSISDITSICNAMDKYPDKIILGCRNFEQSGIPLRSWLGNKISKLVYAWLCGINVSDTQTGLRGLPFRFMKLACRIDGEQYEYETNMLLAAKDNEIEFYEVPIRTIYEDNNESSHFNPLRDSIKIYSVLFKYSISSVLSVAIDYLIFGILNGSGFGVFTSTYIARIFAAVINFGINRNVVFKYKGNLSVQMLKYALLVLTSGTISGFFVSTISSTLGLSTIAVKAFIEFVLYFINYYVQRTYIFVKEKYQ